MRNSNRQRLGREAAKRAPFCRATAYSAAPRNGYDGMQNNL